MKRALLMVLSFSIAGVAGATTFNREIPSSSGTVSRFNRGVPTTTRQYGKEAGLLLDLGKISLGTLNNVEEKKQYLSTVQLEKQRVQNYMLRMVYDNAYTLYKQGDYQRAQELAQTILSIDPNFKQAQTLARQANYMGTYGTLSEEEVLKAKFQEALALYDSGRLVEANDKLDEILTIQPGNMKALSWKRQIDEEIAQEYARRGEVASKQGDYQAALDAWYNSLLMRKEDPSLVAKISDVENKLRQQQLQENMRQALELYNEGKYLEAYAVFERIKKIQPGDARVQKYMSQLKNEIAGGYYQAGCQAYSAYHFDQAVVYWRNAKKWGADGPAMDALIKQARDAKERHIRNQQLRAQQMELEAKQAQENAQKALQQAKEKTEELAQKTEAADVLETITVDNQVPGTFADTIPGALPASPVPGIVADAGGGVTATATLPGTMPDVADVVPGLSGGSGVTRVSAEASAASRAKFNEGLAAYNQNDFERARQAWVVAKQLDPGNKDAELGLRRVEELMMSK